MPGNNSNNSVVVPPLENKTLYRFLIRLIERIDTIAGDSGPKTQTATPNDLRQTSINSAVGTNRENNLNVLLDRIKALETKVEKLQND